MPNNGQNSWRTQKMYSFSEVAHLAHVSASTVRNWLLGYSTEKGRVEPLFQSHDADEKVCSFLELIEIVVAANFRKAEHKSFKLVRLAYDNARKIYKFDYPFARIELKAIGGHIVHIMREPGAILQAIDQPEQYTLPDLVQQIISEQIEYEYELASKWYPVGKKTPIVVNPRISAGVPIIEGRGITVEAIYKRFKADQDISFIEKDFDLKHGIVEKVIRYREKVGI
ncbi:MAG: DUF433 domain-containing protein [Dehalococcoidales bacterium]|nr:DUF433 domain-containing protein [Dehalococcoidales bacterium]